MLRVLLISCFVLVASNLSTGEEKELVDFDKQIRPLLSNKCFRCHGPDENTREAELRLDSKESLFAKRDSMIVTPNSTDKSELFRRISTDDSTELMPPEDSGVAPLSPEEIELIKNWINQGAKWEQHWSFVAPQKVTPPNVSGYAHAVDRFIVKRLAEKKLKLSRKADRVTLIRRLCFDLLGLPPTRQQVDQFLQDTNEDAYERLVDRLLDSPHFGERMAIYWLDVVRYADSNGYHSDEPRSIAPYRDYVIEAFNNNLPYDRFVIEQLAGDLLPKPTMNQKVASGFNMLLQTTSEGGAQAKEYLAKYAADRVRNTSSIFLGVTMGCAECHDHKFDPFTQKDFYSLAAFFSDIQEKGVGNPTAYPITDFAAERELDKLDVRIDELNQKLARQIKESAKQQKEWEHDLLKKQLSQPVKFSDWSTIGPFVHRSFDSAFSTESVDANAIDLQAEVQKLKWKTNATFNDGKVHNLSGKPTAATYLFRTITSATAEEMEISLGSDDAIKVWLNGQLLLEKNTRRGAAPDQEKASLNLQQGENQLLIKIVNDGGGAGFYFQPRQQGLSNELFAILKTDVEKRTDAESEMLAKHFQSLSPVLNATRNEIKKAQAEKKQFEGSLPKTLMTVSTKPRTIRMLPRGNWLDDSGPEMSPQVPEFLHPLAETSGRANRLDLAYWIVDRQNPLTARTFVNRLWKLFYGQGLATPLDDLGAQGTRPTHPELLDWLAMEFIDSRWDVKHMVRLLVTSAAYRQDSMSNESLQKTDPYNRLYARQARFRLDAEMVRDNALAISGLLSNQIGGPSVKPYQPAGYWRHMNFPVRRWKHDKNESQYRRGLYTWWQRMFLHPSLLAFDAPSREECNVERPRSNTPQQALVLLNDPTYVEAARVFAEEILKNGGPSSEDRINWAFRQALSRDANSEEIELLTAIVTQHQQQYAKSPQDADKVLSVGLRPVPDYMNKQVLASWTSISRVILNLHETITRR